MGSSVIAMSMQLSRRLADAVTDGLTDGERFKAAWRLSSLDAAYKQVVMGILGHTNARKSAYQLLGELSQREARTINSTGLPVTDLTHTAAAGGIIGIECLLGQERVFASERELDDLQWRGNPYFQGNNGKPVYHVLSNTIMLEVNLGSYPVSTFVHYIRHPKGLDYSTNSATLTKELETSPTLDEIVLTGAVAIAQMMSDDHEKVKLAMESAAGLIQSIIAHEFGKSSKREKGNT